MQILLVFIGLVCAAIALAAVISGIETISNGWSSKVWGATQIVIAIALAVLCFLSFRGVFTEWWDDQTTVLTVVSSDDFTMVIDLDGSKYVCEVPSECRELKLGQRITFQSLQAGDPSGNTLIRHVKTKG